MSLVEIKREIERLGDEERRELETYLRKLSDSATEARYQRVSALMREMDAGRKYLRSALETTDLDLAKRGL